MAELIKTVYRETEIQYDENANKWLFELHGRERSAGSLLLAKAAIDAPEPKDKKPFTKFSAYYGRYNDNFVLVEVTSIAEATNYLGKPQYWTASKSMGRRKVDANDLIVDSPETVSGIAEIKRLKAEQQKLDEAEREVRNSLKQADLSV